MRALMIIAGAAGALLATQAAAKTSDQNFEARRVSYQGVDFSNPLAVEGFYGRLRDSAQAVCTMNAPTSLRSAQTGKACVAQIMAQAVGKMQRPLLTARHDADNRTRYATGF